jgi:hypothetical protein
MAVSDIFTLPYSLGEALARDLRVTVNSSLTVSMALATFEGPAQAGAIPPSQSWGLVGLRVDLPESATGTSMDKAFEFGRDFGQRSFTLGYDVKAAYQAETGTLDYVGAPAPGVDDLFTLNVEMGLTGLTPELVSAMAAIPVVEGENVWFAPGFMDLGLTRLRLELKDASLVDKILSLSAARQNQDREILRTLAAVSAASTLAFADNRLENSAALGELASQFILKPGSLVIELAPVQPLSPASALGAASQSELLNSLNATVAVNGQSPLTLKFIDPPEPEGLPQEPEVIEELDDFDDLG